MGSGQSFGSETNISIEEARHSKLNKIVIRFVEEAFKIFSVHPQKVSTAFEGGVHVAEVNSNWKIGCSESNLHRHLRGQVGNLDEANATCLMSPQEILAIMEMVPWLVQETLDTRIITKITSSEFKSFGPSFYAMLTRTTQWELSASNFIKCLLLQCNTCLEFIAPTDGLWSGEAAT